MVQDSILLGYEAESLDKQFLTFGSNFGLLGVRAIRFPEKRPELFNQSRRVIA
jgi:hypothetical protein